MEDVLTDFLCSKVEHENLILRKESTARFDGRDEEEDDQDEAAQISSQKYGEFYRAYCTHLQSGDVGRSATKLFQVPIEVMPVILRLPAIERKADLHAIIKAAQKYLLTNYIFDDHSYNTADCTVLQSSATTTLWFACARVVVADFIENHLSGMVTSLREVLPGIEVDTSWYTTGVPYYGATEEEFVCIFGDVAMGPQDIFTTPIDQVQLEVIDPDDVVNPECHTKIEQDLINHGELLQGIPEAQRTGLFWLPMYLSVDFWRSVTSSRSNYSEDHAPMIARKIRKYDLLALNGRAFNVLNDRLDTIPFYTLFLDMISPETIIDPKYWKLIGSAYYTLEEGTPRGLNAWIKILKNALEATSKPSTLRKANLVRLCDKLYGSFRLGERDVKTLAEIARADNPQAYASWHDDWVNEAMICSMDETEGSLAVAFFRKFWLEVLCTHNGEKTMWYVKRGGRIVRDFAGVSVRLMISNTFMQMYNDMRTDITNQNEPGMQHARDEVLDIVRNVIRSLRKQRHKMNMMGALAERFNCPDLKKYIDADPDLTGLSNGTVMVASPNSIHIRPALLQDYINKRFDVFYDPRYTDDHPDVVEYRAWLFKLFVKPDLIHYVRKWIASLFRGGQHWKTLYLWIGVGSNMKTTFQKFICFICGTKAVIMPVDYFTKGKGTANSATPAECCLEGARIMFCEEAEAKVAFLASIVKSETGGDRRKIRALYEEAYDIDPQHQVVIVSNKAPPMSHEDAMVDRVKIIPFVTTMSYNPPKSWEEQVAQQIFLREIDFPDKLYGMRNAAFWDAYHAYDDLVAEGLREVPQSVKTANDNYWAGQDKYTIFLNERLEKDKDSKILVDEAVRKFCTWHSMYYGRNTDCPDREDIMKGLKRVMGEPLAGIWNDYTFKLYGQSK